MSSNEIEFVKGVNKLHAFYTEHVRMLAHAYDLTDRQAATLLDEYGYHNVARSILYPPRVREIPGAWEDGLRDGGRRGDDGPDGPDDDPLR